MIDRKLPPNFNTIEEVNVIQAQELILSNGITVGYINAGTEKVIKLEVVMNAGLTEAKHPVIAFAAADLLDKGTTSMSANQIATAFDTLGAYINTEVSYDKTSLSVFCLSRNVGKVLELLLMVLLEASFPKKELDNYLNNQRQKMKVNLERVSYLAKKRFPELIFGKDHPYTRTVEISDYDAIDLDDIISFYTTKLLSKGMRIQASGDVNEAVLSQIAKAFESIQLVDSEGFVFEKQPNVLASKRMIEKPNAVQSAIRIGKEMFNRTHPDYVKMQLVSTILGGYFGSRLMANIREDKGYTYGIGSAIVPLKNTGYFFLTTEVGNEVKDSALTEIYKEIKLLQDEFISDQELKLVKNYVLGSFLKSVDGPFAQMDKYQLVKENELDYSYFDHYIQSVKELTKEEVKELANRHLQIESLSELVVG
jgi:predicted Zn-dependent peptidase